MNWRKCIHLLLALLVFTSNAGFALNVHYCGGSIASVSLKPQADATCCAAKSMSCCSDKVIKVDKKTDGLVKLQLQFDALTLPRTVSVAHVSATDPISSAQTLEYYCDAHAPPLYELYSQRIFYA